MRTYKWLAALLALLLAGCSLAQPEAGRQENGEDPWIGFYMVPSLGHADGFHDNPYLEEYGTFQVGGLGAAAFPQDVLFAVEDGAGNWIFPGMQGYSLFALRSPLPPEQQSGRERVDYCLSLISDMAPSQERTTIHSTDEGELVTISGTVYYGPPLGASDWDAYGSNIIWDCYRVYQTADGRPYLNGDSSSTDGPMTYSSEETVTRTADGRQYQDTLSASVTVAAAPRLDRLVVTEFDAKNAVLRSEELALRSPLPEVRCEEGAAWVLVEEESEEGTVRTVYNVPGAGEESVSHQIILLDEEGVGELAFLSISCYFF